MYLRLNPDDIENMSGAVLRIYILLELRARGTDAINLPADAFPDDLTPRRLQQIFRTLRDCGMQIKYDRRLHQYQIQWPAAVHQDDLLKHLRTLESARDYTLTRDLIANLRRKYPTMPPEQFRLAVESALISAAAAGVKNGNLARWMSTGIEQSRNQPSQSHRPDAASTASERHESHSSVPSSAKDPRWDEHVRQVVESRPDPVKLYGRKLI